jgi:2-amino-4-hydroxy-6-hydroxymethyldihydropteridine diphosphokinase
MARAFIGLGSNLAGSVAGITKDSQAQVQQALDSIAAHPDITVAAVSSFYQTRAIGPGKQPDYINAAAQLETKLQPMQLLDFLQTIENQQGRVRTIRWGARTLDLDILLFDQQIINSERLQVPHPRIQERAFVLAPLHELAPDLQLPNGENIRQLLANCSMQGIVKQ